MTRRIIASGLAAILVGAVVVALVRAQERAADEQAIRREIESIFQAFIDKDRDKLAATHGKNWRGYLTGSRSVIKGRDGYMRAAVGTGSMPPKGQGMVAYRILEYDTIWYGDVAVVSFVAEADYVQGDLKTATKLTLMDIYAKEDGRWMQVASQTSLHPDQQERRASELLPMSEPMRQSLLDAREAVWRAWYGGDTTLLAAMLPPELVTLGPGPSGWGAKDVVIKGSENFAVRGGKLTRLEFPRTEIQAYGNTAIIYTSYELDVAEGGKTRTDKGKATEVFVRRGGKWLNSGWQLAPEARDVK